VRTFTFRTSRFAPSTKVEVDRHWVRITSRKGQTHVDFSSLESLHYGESAKLFLTDRSGATFSLPFSGINVDNTFKYVDGPALATLVSIAAVRPDLQVVLEDHASQRLFLAMFVLVAATAITMAMVVFDAERDTTKIVTSVGIVVFVAGYVMFRYGPPRKKAQTISVGEAAKQMAE
jgi:hypothetical protein